MQQARTNVEQVTKILRCLADENKELQQEKEEHQQELRDMQKQNVELKETVEQLSSELSMLRSAIREMQLELVQKTSMMHGFFAGFRWFRRSETQPMGKARSVKKRFRGLQCFERRSEDMEIVPLPDQEAPEGGLAKTAAPALGLGLVKYRIANLEGAVKDGDESEGMTSAPGSSRDSLGSSRRSLGSSGSSDWETADLQVGALQRAT